MPKRDAYGPRLGWAAGVGLLLLGLAGLATSVAQDFSAPRAPLPPSRESPQGEGGDPDSQAAAVCPDGPALTVAEAEALARTAAAALDDPTLTVAVVDRPGNILAVFRKVAADPGNDDLVVGLARTAAFFSNNQAPLSSRTVRFVSGIHFPPGVKRTPNAALYGIENTNRGCELNVTFNPGKEVPPAKSVAGGPCNPFDTSGCGPGIVTGKLDPLDTDPTPEDIQVPVNPGGVPLFRGGAVVGGIGVAGVNLPGNHAEFAAFSAVAGNGFLPSLPLPTPGAVFIDGIRLPFVEQTRRPPGTAPDLAVGPALGSFLLLPQDGACAPDGYLVGPMAGSQLTAAEVDRIVQQAVAVAARTRAVIRLPAGSRARMVLAVGDLDGTILGLFRMSDSTLFSIDVAVAKARNVVYFSGPDPAVANDLPGVPPGTAITNRTVSFGAQPLYPPGIDGTSPGPFFDLFLRDTANPCSQGAQAPNLNQNGVVFFPGSLPLYRDGMLVGGLGVSGDGVEQDDYVAFFGAQGFQPLRGIWADRVVLRRVRLPFLKFPRNPER